MRTFHLVSLGCAKNLVDSELIIGDLTSAGWKFAEDPESADLLMLNTCGFIQPAVEEGIDEILELARIKENNPGQKLVMVGCLVQRYKESLAEELSEVDLFVGTEWCHDMAKRVESLFNDDQMIGSVQIPERFVMNSGMPRILTTPFFKAWFKFTI